MWWILALLSAVTLVHVQTRSLETADADVEKVVAKRSIPGANPVTCLPQFEAYQIARRKTKPKFQHSACRPPSPYLTTPLDHTLDLATRKHIVDTHNKYRGTFNDSVPKNERKQYWDDELALVAQGWANALIVQHDCTACKRLPGRFWVTGQNIAAGVKSWDIAMALWYNEHKNFKIGVGKVDPNGVQIGHFTQLLWANSFLVGCAYAEGSRKFPYRRIFVCNYAPGGNANLKYPFQVGERASSCDVQFREQGKCDCSTIKCYKGDGPDEFCQCKCDKGWDGLQCDIPVQT